jgi:hypothetical protein
MNLIPKIIAGACMAASSIPSLAAFDCSVTAFADALAAEAFVKNCAPKQTLFISGVGGFTAGFQKILRDRIFDTTAMAPIRIIDSGSYSSTQTSTITDAYIGKSLPMFGNKLTLVVYKNDNQGSGGGAVSQVLANRAPKLADALSFNPLHRLPEADVVFVGPAKDATTPGGTVANAFCGGSSTRPASRYYNTATSLVPFPHYEVVCESHTTAVADVALSHVAAGDHHALYSIAAKSKISSLRQTPIVLQSFGVVVSPKLYAALQTKNLAESSIPSTCTAGDTTAACQPTIKRTEYASLISKAGSIKTLAAITGDASLTSQKLVVARFDDLSSFQAASNIFFLNGECGGNGKQAIANSIDSRVQRAGGRGGGQPAINGDDSLAFPGLQIQSASEWAHFVDAVTNPDTYAIGVVRIAQRSIGVGSARFVKIDGVSPNYVNDVADNFTQLANGSYPFAMVAHAMVNESRYRNQSTDKQRMIDALINALKDSSFVTNGQDDKSLGAAYFGGAGSAQQSKVVRPAGDNCAPLMFGTSP